jgi:ADP-dependent NAD(P)H-hydrate dehydratase / NAD(P)H-hydrate epimerase
LKKSNKLKIYSAKNIRKWDTFTIEKEPIASVDLMERAATLCTKHIIAGFYFESAMVICGTGNNGGDGLVIARLLAERGTKVKVIILEIGSSRSEDFEANLKRLDQSIDRLTIKKDERLPEITEDLIVDAIFGSGLNKGIEGWLAEVIGEINSSKAAVASVDIPSGLFADIPMKEGQMAVRATKTFSFQCPKLSFFFREHDSYLGDWIVIDIGLHPDFEEKEEAIYVRKEMIKLNPKKRSDHKGSNGFLAAISGLGGMPGAAILASKAAYRTGCGYVATTASNDASYSALLSALPEALLIDGAGLKLPSKTNAILIGPGIGTSAKAQEWVQLVLESDLPSIWDADALNILAKIPELQSSLKENTILTPHIGELKRLLGDQRDSLELLKAQREFSISQSVFIIQKGPNSKLSCPDGTLYINSTANPGMATAGMGDVLSGMIASLLAQGYDPGNAALIGMYLHGLAGDIVAKKQGIRGLISSDVVETIPEAMRSF